jgi:hypothetical protein
MHAAEQMLTACQSGSAQDLTVNDVYKFLSSMTFVRLCGLPPHSRDDAIGICAHHAQAKRCGKRKGQRDRRPIPAKRLVDLASSHKIEVMAGQGSAGNVLAALCSFFIPGLGQLLKPIGDGDRPVVWLQLWFVLLNWIIHLWSILDAARKPAFNDYIANPEFWRSHVS